MKSSRLRQLFLAITSPQHREILYVVVGTLLVIAAHLHYAIAGFGEQDAARLANDAIRWHLDGFISVANTEYRLRTSPLYLHGLRVALDYGLPFSDIPLVINRFSAVMSGVALTALYYVFRRLSDTRVAAATVLVYAITPAFWLGSIYGMPTIPGLAAFAISVLWFARALDAPTLRSVEVYAALAASTLFAFVAFSFKADIVLTGSIYLIFALRRKTGRLAAVALASGVVCVGLLGTLSYTKLLARPEAAVKAVGSAEFIDKWNDRFPFKFEALFDPANSARITHGMTTLLFAVALYAILHGLVANRGRAKMMAGVLAWSLPTLLFWGFRFGNSARHNLPIYPALIFAVMLCVFDSVKSTRRAAALVVLLLGATQLDQSGNGTVNPGPNFLVETRRLEVWSQGRHERTRCPSDPKAKRITGDIIPYRDYAKWVIRQSPDEEGCAPRLEAR